MGSKQSPGPETNDHTAKNQQQNYSASPCAEKDLAKPWNQRG